MRAYSFDLRQKVAAALDGGDSIIEEGRHRLRCSTTLTCTRRAKSRRSQRRAGRGSGGWRPTCPTSAPSSRAGQRSRLSCGQRRRARAKSLRRHWPQPSARLQSQISLACSSTTATGSHSHERRCSHRCPCRRLPQAAGLQNVEPAAHESRCGLDICALIHRSLPPETIRICPHLF